MKICKTFLSVGFGSMLNTDTLFYFFFKDTKHQSLKQKTPTETKGTSQTIWLRHALGKMHPNAGGFTFHWIFFSVFSQTTLSHSANGNSMMIPSPYNQFWVTFPSSPALLPLKNPNPQVSTTPCEAVSQVSQSQSTALLPKASWEQTISFPLG